MAMTGGVHVLVTVQDQPHRPLQVVCRDRGCTGGVDGARLLTAKTAAQALGARNNLVPGNAQRVRHVQLVVSGCLNEIRATQPVMLSALH